MRFHAAAPQLLVAALAIAACLCARHAQADARFCISATALEFGNVLVGNTASGGATIVNCGDRPFTFTDVGVHPATGAAFHVSTTCATGMTLAPGAACSASIVFAPTLTGQTSGGLWLDNSTADATPLLAFYGRGIDAQAGMAALTITPPSAEFAPQPIGTQSPALVVTLHNGGPAALTLANIILGGPDAYDFSGLENGCVVGASIPAGQSCTLSLLFDPQAAGARDADLVIDSPQLVDLAILPIAGTGATGDSSRVTVVEYYDAAFDHYFLTPLASEIALCDAQQAPCTGWVRSGRSFSAFASTAAPTASVGVCRFFNDSFAPKSSHFYALHGLGCEQTIALFPDWQLESSALFNTYVPDASGNCVAGSIPVYRLYNNGMGGAPNHRYTTDVAVRAQMMAAAWVPEGNGIGVAFCAPQ